MKLWSAIVQGFGFTVGSRAADEAIVEVRETLDRAELAAAERQKAEAHQAKVRAKQQARESGERRRAAERREREIERELQALKARIKTK